MDSNFMNFRWQDIIGLYWSNFDRLPKRSNGFRIWETKYGGDQHGDLNIMTWKYWHDNVDEMTLGKCSVGSPLALCFNLLEACRCWTSTLAICHASYLGESFSVCRFDVLCFQLSDLDYYLPLYFHSCYIIHLHPSYKS